MARLVRLHIRQYMCQPAHPVLEGHFEGLQPEEPLMGLHHLPWAAQLHPHHGHVQLIMGIQQSPLGQGQGPASQVQLALALQHIQMGLGLTHQSIPCYSCRHTHSREDACASLQTQAQTSQHGTEAGEATEA